jgi:hypothetical protein
LRTVNRGQQRLHCGAQGRGGKQRQSQCQSECHAMPERRRFEFQITPQDI